MARNQPQIRLLPRSRPACTNTESYQGEALHLHTYVPPDDDDDDKNISMVSDLETGMENSPKATKSRIQHTSLVSTTTMTTGSSPCTSVCNPSESIAMRRNRNPLSPPSSHKHKSRVRLAFCGGLNNVASCPDLPAGGNIMQLPSSPTAVAEPEPEDAAKSRSHRKTAAAVTAGNPATGSDALCSPKLHTTSSSSALSSTVMTSSKGLTRSTWHRHSSSKTLSPNPCLCRRWRHKIKAIATDEVENVKYSAEMILPPLSASKNFAMPLARTIDRRATLRPNLCADSESRSNHTGITKTRLLRSYCHGDFCALTIRYPQPLQDMESSADPWLVKARALLKPEEIATVIEQSEKSAGTQSVARGVKSLVTGNISWP